MKADILQMGTIENGVPSGWHFDCYYTNAQGEKVSFDGTHKQAGYTINELQELLNNK